MVHPDEIKYTAPSYTDIIHGNINEQVSVHMETKYCGTKAKQ